MVKLLYFNIKHIKQQIVKVVSILILLAFRIRTQQMHFVQQLDDKKKL